MMTGRLSRAARSSLPILLASLIVALVAMFVLPDPRLAYGIAAVATGFALVRFMRQATGSVDGWFRRVPPAPALEVLDEALRARLGGGTGLTNRDYDDLVGYFAAGVRQYRSVGCAHVLYPGVPGTFGMHTEGMEGFTRTAPLLACWVLTRGDFIPLPDGTTFDAFGHIVSGLQAGTQPASREYWGPATDFDLRIVEAGDVALVAWLLRDRLREAMPGPAQAALLNWLSAATAQRIYGGGNWHLFCVAVGLALEAWGCPRDPQTRAHYRAFKQSHRGRGWFVDGDRVDHYNAWQMHYFLPFFMRMDPELDTAFITGALRDVSRDYSWLFTPSGFPFFGRSGCYRMALPTPLVMAAALPDDPFPAGVARRAMDAVWSHFIGHGALNAGAVTQGYEGPQPDVLENYSGRGSCHWSLRSLTAAYFQGPGGPIWNAVPEPLPVERESFDIVLVSAGLRVIGTRESGAVEVRPLDNAGAVKAEFVRMSVMRRLGEAILLRPLRPDNIAAKYGRPSYRSDIPFCCARDDGPGKLDRC